MYNLTPIQKEVLDYLKQYYADNGFAPTMKEVADSFGKSIPTVQGYFGELEKKGAISKDPHQSRSILITDVAESTTDDVVVSGVISAGDGVSVLEEGDEYIKVPSSWLNDNLSDYYSLKVKGFSMYEDGILDGDYIIVRKQSYASNGDIVVGIIHEEYDEKATLKKYFDDGDHVRLEPSNPVLAPKIIPKQSFEIRGRFIGLIRK